MVYDGHRTHEFDQGIRWLKVTGNIDEFKEEEEEKNYLYPQFPYPLPEDCLNIWNWTNSQPVVGSWKTFFLSYILPAGRREKKNNTWIDIVQNANANKFHKWMIALFMSLSTSDSKFFSYSFLTPLNRMNKRNISSGQIASSMKELILISNMCSMYSNGA